MKTPRRFAAIMLALSWPCSAISQVGIHVPQDAPTIQAAIELADSGDAVLVAPGVYFENVDFLGKSILVQSLEGPSVTTIDAGGVGRAVSFTSGETAASVLDGFRITGGCACAAPALNGGGILCQGSSPTIRRCVIEGNEAANPTGSGGWGGGVAVLSGGSPSTAPTFDRCTIAANTAKLQAGGVWVNGTGGGVTPTFTNSIVWGNTSPGDSGIVDGFGAASTVTYSATQEPWPGAGNLSTDPLFAAVGVGDLSLQAGSPCIDAGDPSALPDLDGTLPDMGAVPATQATPWVDLGHSLPSAYGTPTLTGTGDVTPTALTVLALTGARPFAQAPLVVGATELSAPFKQGVLVPFPQLIRPFTVDGFGASSLAFPWPVGVPSGFTTYVQQWVADATAPAGWAASNALSVTSL